MQHKSPRVKIKVSSGLYPLEFSGGHPCSLACGILLSPKPAMVQLSNYPSLVLTRSHNTKVASSIWRNRTGASQVALVLKNPPVNAGDIKRHRFNPWVGKISWRRKWQTTPVFLKNPIVREAWQAMVHGIKN